LLITCYQKWTDKPMEYANNRAKNCNIEFWRISKFTLNLLVTGTVPSGQKRLQHKMSLIKAAHLCATCWHHCSFKYFQLYVRAIFFIQIDSGWWWVIKKYKKQKSIKGRWRYADSGSASVVARLGSLTRRWRQVGQKEHSWSGIEQDHLRSRNVRNGILNPWTSRILGSRIGLSNGHQNQQNLPDVNHQNRIHSSFKWNEWKYVPSTSSFPARLFQSSKTERVLSWCARPCLYSGATGSTCFLGLAHPVDGRPLEIRIWTSHQVFVFLCPGSGDLILTEHSLFVCLTGGTRLTSTGRWTSFLAPRFVLSACPSFPFCKYVAQDVVADSKIFTSSGTVDLQ